MNKTIFAIAVAMLSSAAFAQPAPSPKVGELKTFLGLWRCSGKTLVAPQHPTRAWINVVMTLRDFWVDVDFSEDRTSDNPHPNGGKVHWGWDEGTQKYTGYAIDNGGGINSLESDGFTGDTIVWRGMERIGGAAFPTRDTFKKTSATQIDHTGEAFVNGVWVTLDQETCRKFHLF